MNLENKTKELMKKGFTVLPAFPIKWWDPEIYTKKEIVESYRADICWDKFARECVEKAIIKQTDIIADLGCGTGVATQKILDKNPSSVYAIDPSRPMLNILNKIISHHSLKIIQGNIEELMNSRLPKPNKIISHGVFVVIQNKQDLLKKIYSYLPKNGFYIFTIEDWHNAFNGISLQESEIQIAEFVFEKTGKKLPIHMSEEYPTFDLEETKALITKTGGNILEYQTKQKISPGEKYAKAYTGLYSPKILSAINEFYTNKKIVELVQHLFVTIKKAK